VRAARELRKGKRSFQKQLEAKLRARLKAMFEYQ